MISARASCWSCVSSQIRGERGRADFLFPARRLASAAAQRRFGMVESREGCETLGGVGKEGKKKKKEEEEVEGGKKKKGEKEQAVLVFCHTPSGFGCYL